jgi:hypothetical protein
MTAAGHQQRRHRQFVRIVRDNRLGEIQRSVGR